MCESPIEAVFTDHFRTNHWRHPETVSGPGSTVRYTENLRRHLPGLFESLGVGRLLDAPCGDYNWFRLVPRPDDVQYIGGEIVRELVETNRERYESANTRFIRLDITADDLPDADLWICRDVLFHFSDRDILATVSNFARSRIRYLLTSSHTECRQNADIATGGLRWLNPCLPPFNWPEPILWIDDWIEGYPVRRMGLWERATLA